MLHNSCGAFAPVGSVIPDLGSFKGRFIIYGMGAAQVTEILITLANHLIYGSFLQNILFGP